jgi:hypothetical protein
MECDYAEENISTKQPPPREKARVQGADGDKERPGRSEATPSQGPQAFDGTTLLRFDLTKETRLAKRAEFLRVYEQGKRIDGRFMTVFILPNEGEIQRLGVTATKKGNRQGSRPEPGKATFARSVSFEPQRTRRAIDEIRLGPECATLDPWCKLEKPLESLGGSSPGSPELRFWRPSCGKIGYR